MLLRHRVWNRQRTARTVRPCDEPTGRMKVVSIRERDAESLCGHATRSSSSVARPFTAVEDLRSNEATRLKRNEIEAEKGW